MGTEIQSIFIEGTCSGLQSVFIEGYSFGGGFILSLSKGTVSGQAPMEESEGDLRRFRTMCD